MDRKNELLKEDEWHKREEASLSSPDSTLAPSDELPVIIDVLETELVGQLTGADSLNHTAARWDIYGTDLGHMFWHRDELYMVFGDTFGEGGRGGKNWRSNALARLADPDPAQGLRIEAMITGPDGAAKELIASRKIAGIEKTVIPTHGISVDGRMYLHYMSVRRWGEQSGQWDVRYSGFAYSDDDGQTWHTPPSAIWPKNTGFEQVALVHGDAYVYTLGIPGGRWGGIRLRRVAPQRILDLRAYEYWNGEGWVTDPKAAIMIVPSPVGELSVAWSAPYQKWLMMYLNPERHAVVLRTAPELTGPWGEEQVVMTAEQYPGLYAPYIVPVSNLGDDVYFTVSMWGHYNVFLMHMRLQGHSDALHARNGSSP
ncbi:MAG: DUF4185 domain-containing protein [Nitrococcus sp.]|nr:DUF4185 domain-containing protein [Nitrococcus sp.]